MKTAAPRGRRFVWNGLLPLQGIFLVVRHVRMIDLGVVHRNAAEHAENEPDQKKGDERFGVAEQQFANTTTEDENKEHQRT